MTTLQDVREILAGSEPSAWIPFPETGVWTFREDVQLRIRRDERVERSFTAPWTRGIQGDNETYGYPHTARESRPSREERVFRHCVGTEDRTGR
jgi:hypothetical protein